MGMYTGLRFKVIIKPEFRQIMEEIINTDKHFEWGVYENTPFTTEWKEYSRSSFIPWGCVCYMPDEWGDNINQYDKQTGTWQVVCSLKNYSDTIEYFLENVLAKIIEDFDYIEALYEEDDAPYISIKKDVLANA